MYKRINWVDIYKGLAILLVVVGHSTGLFNPYIYQFHMAAFFFISGYTSRLGGKGILQTTAGKAYSIYVPYFVFFLCSLGLVWLLQASGGYSFLFKDPFPGVIFSLKEFFNHRIYLNFLGATWFLSTLFGIYVFQRLLLFVCFDRPGIIYFSLSLIFLFIGYGIVKATTYIPDNFFYLIYIGQFYFTLGVFFSEKDWFAWIVKRRWTLVPMFLVNILLFFVFSHLWPNTVDYPSRSFGNALGNGLAAINGIFFLFGISLILDKLRWQQFSILMVKTGQNTLGVVFFHFLFFKVGYFILALVGVVKWSYLSNFVPTLDIGREYWWLISGISLTLSVGAWFMLLKIPFAQTLFGQNKEFMGRYFENTDSFLMKSDSVMMEKRALLAQSLTRLSNNFFKNNGYLAFGLACLIVLAIIPLLFQGIICNDELQSRYWAQLGWGQFWNHFNEVWVKQGRSLGGLLNISSMYLGFLSTNVVLFRSFSILIMLIVFGLFGWLVARLLKCSSFGFAVFFASVLLLPISFEHTLPNAFVTLFSIPLSIAFVSFHLFLSYLEQRKAWMLFTSVLIWFFFLTGYEAFITLTPVFLIIAVIKRNSSWENFGEALYECRYPMASSALFLMAYFAALKFFPSHYAGNSIAELDIRSSGIIIQQLFMSGIPGYYLINPKYQYLFNIYSDSFQSMGSVLATSPLATLLETIFPITTTFLANLRNSLSDLRVVSLVGISLSLAWILSRKERTVEPLIEGRRLPLLMIVPLGMALVVSIPNSLGKLYQGTVNSNLFAALPVSFLVFGFLVFALIVLLWYLWERMSQGWGALVLMAVVVVLVFPIQAMNGVFAQEQYRNFTRLTMLESAFDTALFHHLDTNAVFAPDFYITKNLLAINEGYWSDYSKNKGLNLDISSKFSGQSYMLKVLSDRQLALLSDGKIVLLSLERVDDRKLIFNDPSLSDHNAFGLGSGVKDGVFYKYFIDTKLPTSNRSSSSLLTLDKNDKLPVITSEGFGIGNTFKNASIQSGFFDDGWVAKDAALKIKTGKSGKIILSGFLTIPRTNDMMIEVLDNNKIIGKYKVDKENFQLMVPVNSGNQIAQLSFRANWEFDAAKPDIRKLSYLLVELHGE